jgi:hypothetical protein
VSIDETLVGFCMIPPRIEGNDVAVARTHGIRGLSVWMPVAAILTELRGWQTRSIDGFRARYCSGAHITTDSLSQPRASTSWMAANSVVIR